MRVSLAASFVLTLAVVGCGGSEEVTSTCPTTCDVDHQGLPRCGQVELLARTPHDDYVSATFSFRYATALEDGRVLNDWDLLFGNDQDPDLDHFTVNMVTDDRSFIVDLGPTSICAVPEVVDPEGYPLGLYGEHDYIPVEQGHLYVVRTEDTDHRQWAVFDVVRHVLNQSVTIRWYRSPDPERFVAPEECGEES